MWGYAGFLAAVADPGHEEHDELLERAGGQFDPEFLDLAALNRALAPSRATIGSRAPDRWLRQPIPLFAPHVRTRWVH